MSERPRDWDKELAAIDRAMAGMPANAPPTRASPPVLPPPAPSRGARLGSWIKVLLGLALALGITQWPYRYDCGRYLAFYWVAVILVVMVGTWSAISTWRRRLGFAHALSLLVTLLGLVLAARELLPRVGYAKFELQWVCRE